MSDNWIATRDWSEINLDQGIINSLLNTRDYIRVLAKVAPDGSVSYNLIDKNGFISGNFNP